MRKAIPPPIDFSSGTGVSKVRQHCNPGMEVPLRSCRLGPASAPHADKQAVTMVMETACLI